MSNTFDATCVSGYNPAYAPYLKFYFEKAPKFMKDYPISLQKDRETHKNFMVWITTFNAARSVHATAKMSEEDPEDSANQEENYNASDDEKYFQPAEVAGTNFRLKARNLILTYRTYIDKQDYCDFIHNIKVKGKKVKASNPANIYIAHEKASSDTNYEHSHVLLMYDQTNDITNSLIFDYQGIHPNIKYIATLEHLNNVYRYLCKEDHSLDFLLDLIKDKEEKLTPFELVKRHKKLEDLLPNLKKFSDVIPAMKLHETIHSQFDNSRLSDDFYSIKLSWQEQLKAELLSNQVYRKIIWIVDTGNTGKSEFCRHMQHHYYKQTVYLNSLGGDQNSASIILEERKRGWDGTHVFLDLSRSHSDHKIYGALENIANGKITNTKYKTENHMFPPGNVVVFANWLPRFSALSRDRWDIRQIATKLDESGCSTFDDKSEFPISKININDIKQLKAVERHLAGIKGVPHDDDADSSDTHFGFK